MTIRDLCVRAAAAIATATAILAFSGPAAAQAGPPAGRLHCSVGSGLGLIVASQRPMECRFTPRRGPVQRYVGIVRNFGLDVGSFKRVSMNWQVYGPYARAPLGALNGQYVGATAGASAGVGATGNLLIGGNANKVRLQPLSLQGSRGVNVALGVTRLDLVLERRRGRK
jgi:hypothetical protein